MEPWYKVATPRKEVREGRSFNPDEFAIALEQVVAGTAPEDYRDPAQFFARTCFTRALREHAGMVLRRLSGRTDNTAPVLTLITQFGGGKTHTLTTLYHLAKNGDAVGRLQRGRRPGARGGRRVGAQGEGRRLRGQRLGPAAGARDAVDRHRPPARGRQGRRGAWAGGEDHAARHRGDRAGLPGGRRAGAPALRRGAELPEPPPRQAESFHAFIQNLTVATTGTTHGAAVISLPRSQVEMTEWDQEWQDKISKVVRRVAKDLIANDETEISEVVRRRLFQDLGSEKIRKNVAKAYGDWCFERRAQLPPEWTAVDSAATEAKAREFLQRRFEACYPFHPATLSVFQRKWQALPQYQQTRGTLAMLAQWISIAAQDGFQQGAHRAAHHARLGAARGARIPQRRAGSARRVAPRRRDRHGHRRRAGAQQGARRRHQGAAAGHPPACRHRDPLRVVGRADRQGRAPARAALRARRARAGHDIDRQRRVRARGPVVLRPQGGRGRLPDRLPADDEEGGERPARVARRGDRDQARDAQARRGRVPARREHPGRGLPARWGGDPGHAEADARRGRSGGGVVGRRLAARAARRVDAPAREVAAALSGSARLVPQEAGPGPARQGGAGARVEAGGARGRRGHARW